MSQRQSLDELETAEAQCAIWQDAAVWLADHGEFYTINATAEEKAAFDARYEHYLDLVADTALATDAGAKMLAEIRELRAEIARLTGGSNGK